jgi:hypothetical protein
MVKMGWKSKEEENTASGLFETMDFPCNTQSL